jgi:hypothetical protein
VPDDGDAGRDARGAQPIRIDLHRTGGFGGIPVRGSIDLAALPREQAAELTDLIERVDFAALERGPADTRRPDEFRYDLSISYPDRRDHLVVGDSSAPPSLRALIARVLELAQRR